MKAKTNEVSLIDQHDEYLKMKKKLMMNKRKRKRRRRISSHSSDHTESDQEDDLSDLSDLSEGAFRNLMKLKMYFSCLTNPVLPRKAQNNNIRCHSVNNADLVSLKSKLNINLTEFGKICVSAGIYLFKVNNRNTRIMFEICSKLTIKILERLH